jgi:hypothetical protein
MKLSRTKIAKLLKIGNQSRKNRQSKSLGQRPSFLQKNEMIDIHGEAAADGEAAHGEAAAANKVLAHKKHKSLHTRPKKKQRTAQKGKRQMNLRFKTMKKHAWHKKQFKQKGGVEYTVTLKGVDGIPIPILAGNEKISTEEQQTKKISELFTFPESTDDSKLYYKNKEVNKDTVFKTFIADNKIQDSTIALRLADYNYKFLYDLLHGDKYYLIDVEDIPKLMTLILQDISKKFEDLYVLKDDNFESLPNLSKEGNFTLLGELLHDIKEIVDQDEFMIRLKIRNFLKLKSVEDSKIPVVSKLQYLNTLQKVNKIYSMMNVQDYIISSDESFIKNWVSNLRLNKMSTDPSVSEGDRKNFQRAKTSLDILVKDYATNTLPIIEGDGKAGMLWKVSDQLKSNRAMRNDIINNLIQIEYKLNDMFGLNIVGPANNDKTAKEKMQALYLDFTRTISGSSLSKILKTKDNANKFVVFLNSGAGKVSTLRADVYDKLMEIIYFTTTKIIPIANEYAGKTSGTSASSGQVPEGQSLKNLLASVNTIKTAVSEINMFVLDNKDDVVEGEVKVDLSKKKGTDADEEVIVEGEGEGGEVFDPSNLEGTNRFREPPLKPGEYDYASSEEENADANATRGSNAPNKNSQDNFMNMLGKFRQGGGGYNSEIQTYIKENIKKIEDEINKSQAMMDKIVIEGKPEYITKFSKVKEAFKALKTKTETITDTTKIKPEVDALTAAVKTLSEHVSGKIKTPAPIGTAAKAAKAKADAEAKAAAEARAAVPPTELENLKTQILGLKQEIAELKPGVAQDVASIRAFMTGEDALSHTLKFLVDVPKWQQFKAIADLGNTVEDTMRGLGLSANKADMEKDRQTYMALFMPLPDPVDPSKEAERAKSIKELMVVLKTDKLRKLKETNDSVNYEPHLDKLIKEIEDLIKEAGKDEAKIKVLVDKIIDYKYKPDQQFIEAAKEAAGAAGPGPGAAGPGAAVIVPPEVYAAIAKIDPSKDEAKIKADTRPIKEVLEEFMKTDLYTKLAADDANKKIIEDYLKTLPAPPAGTGAAGTGAAGTGAAGTGAPGKRVIDQSIVDLMTKIDPSINSDTITAIEPLTKTFKEIVTEFTGTNEKYKASTDKETKDKITAYLAKPDAGPAPGAGPADKTKAPLIAAINKFIALPAAAALKTKYPKIDDTTDLKPIIAEIKLIPEYKTLLTPEEVILIDAPITGGGSRKKHRSRKHRRSHNKRSHNKRSHKRSHNKRSHY